MLWEQGGIGNAEWTGVPLSVLLNKAGIKSGAIEIILEGADEGEITVEPKSPGTIKLARSLSWQYTTNSTRPGQKNIHG